MVEKRPAYRPDKIEKGSSVSPRNAERPVPKHKPPAPPAAPKK